MTRVAVMLSPWCDKHWAPFRAGVRAKTHSAVAATQVMLASVVRHPDFIRRAERYAVPGKKPGNAELQWAFEKTSPQCCFLGDAGMSTILEATSFANMTDESRLHYERIEAELLERSRRGQPTEVAHEVFPVLDSET